MPACFVITGYGIKKDYINNRDIDLDKTFKHIIKPVFEDLGYECKRSCDYPPGMIDAIMYRGIYTADFVIADISTLNPNALYELGVRHALKPYTTLVICEDSIFVNNKLPFDLTHLTALAYRHDGKSLDIDEVDRFRKILKEAVTGMIKTNEVDSPVFTHIEGLEISIKKSESDAKQEEGPVRSTRSGSMGVAKSDEAVPLRETDATTGTPTLSDMIDNAVSVLESKKFDEAIVLFKKLLEIKPGDPFFIQQLCLATYKSAKPEPIAANKEAYSILEQLNPLSSTDTETLGMAGAVHKNLYNLTGDKAWLEKSLRFYESGYYIVNDYYNGINTAFLYWKLASLGSNKEESLFHKMQAKQIAKNVVEICTTLRQQGSYTKRNDKEWITNTLAEAYYGMDDKTNFDQLVVERSKEQSGLSEDSFRRQFDELKTIKEKVEKILK